MQPASIFSSHMVLQRDRPIPVWGWALPGDTISIEFAGQSRAAVADRDGRWSLTLDPLPAFSEGRDFVIRSKGESRAVTFSDVLVGEVWLASGQSNMEWALAVSNNADAELASANHPLIRLFSVPVRTLANPPHTVDGSWSICSPSTVSRFSAVAYFFGRNLQVDLGVPIGLIHASKGGTPVEAWTSRDSLIAEASGKKTLESYEAGPSDPVARRDWELHAEDAAAWFRSKVPADPGNDGFGQGWAAPDFDDSGWDTMETPSKWQEHGHGYSGVFWFRREIEVPPAWAGKELVLQLGACDKHDTTYFNGVQVGAMSWEVADAWCTPRVYRIPGNLVRPGRNVIAVRIYSYMTDGGLIGLTDKMGLSCGEASTHAPIPLTGAWRYKVEHNFGPQTGPVEPLGPGNPNTPCILFDNMIRPLAPVTMRGAIWYQGESNAWAPMDYRILFPAMIRDWRRTFHQPDLAFLFVQLANYQPVQQEPVEHGSWAELREAQLLTLREPGTGMAVTIDVGDAADIHPRNKQDVGKRLALAALAQVYGKDIVFSGPLFRSHKIEGDSVRIYFDHAVGLKTSDGSIPKGFAIAGSDQAFHWAEVRIDGETVVVRSNVVSNPTAVRYGWAMNPLLNLCNAADLPTSPFRTDQV